MEPLKWVFELFDKISGPAKNMAKALGMFGNSVSQGRDEMTKFNTTTKTSQSLMESVKQGFGISWGLAIAEGAKKAAVAVFDLGTEMIRLVSFRESTMQSLSLMLGGEGPAKEFFNQAMVFARQTPFSPEQVINSMKSLVGGGFTAEEAKVLFQATGDVAAMSGGGEAAMASLSLVMSQIKGRGTLTTQDLNQLVNTSGAAGLGRAKIFEGLAKNLGVETSEIPGMMEKGLIPADAAIFSFAESAKARFGGLGNGMAKQAETMAGMWSNVLALPSEFVIGMDLEKSTGAADLKAAMTSITDTFAVAGGKGQALQSILTGAFNFIGGAVKAVVDVVMFFIDQIQVGDNLKALFGGGEVDWIEVLKFALVAIGSVISVVIQFFLDMADAVAMAFRGFKMLYDFLSNIGTFFEDIGKSISDGFAGGIFNGLSNIKDLMTGFSDTVIETPKTQLKTHSPSQVFEEMGMNTALGYQQGVEDGTSGAQDAVGSLVGFNGQAAVPGGAGGAGAQVHLEIHVDNTGHADGDTIAERIAQILPTHLASLFDQFAMEGGQS